MFNNKEYGRRHRRSESDSLKMFRWLKERRFMFVEERTAENMRYTACFAYINGKWYQQFFCKENDDIEAGKITLTWDSVFRHVQRIWRESGES